MKRYSAFRLLLAAAVLLSLLGLLSQRERERSAAAAQFRVIAGDRVRALDRAIGRRAQFTDALAHTLTRDHGSAARVPDLLDTGAAPGAAILWATWNGTGEPTIQRFGSAAPDSAVWLKDALARAARSSRVITVPSANHDGAELLVFARRVPQDAPLLGVVIVATPVRDLVERAISPMEPAAVELILEDESLGGRMLYAHRSPRTSPASNVANDFPLRFADRNWIVRTR
jgi:hypothetical protein